MCSCIASSCLLCGQLSWTTLSPLPACSSAGGLQLATNANGAVSTPNCGSCATGFNPFSPSAFNGSAAGFRLAAYARLCCIPPSSCLLNDRGTCPSQTVLQHASSGLQCLGRPALCDLSVKACACYFCRYANLSSIANAALRNSNASTTFLAAGAVTPVIGASSTSNQCSFGETYRYVAQVQPIQELP